MSDRVCWKCGTALTIEIIRWGRDVNANAWFVHRATKTPVSPLGKEDEAEVPICK